MNTFNSEDVYSDPEYFVKRDEEDRVIVDGNSVFAVVTDEEEQDAVIDFYTSYFGKKVVFEEK